jgi:HSP20 family protein
MISKYGIKEEFIMKGLVPFNRGLFNFDFEDDFDDFFDRKLIPLRRHMGKDTFKLDLQEKENEYLIEADLPGVAKEDLKVQLNDETLNISVEREEKIDEENKNYIHKERRYCSMNRSIYLPSAKKDGINAKLDNGVLRITVPKETVKPDESIKINVE